MLKDYRMPSLRDKIEGISNQELEKKVEELKQDTKKAKIKVGKKKLGKKK